MISLCIGIKIYNFLQLLAGPDLSSLLVLLYKSVGSDRWGPGKPTTYRLRAPEMG